MKPPLNNFRLQRLSQAQASAQPQPSTSAPAPVVKGMRGLTGEEKAQAMSSMSQDVSVRANRIQYLKTLGQKIYDEVSQEAEIGSSRLAWLNKQLNQSDF